MMLKRDVTFALAWLMTWPALAQTTTPAPPTPAPPAPPPPPPRRGGRPRLARK